MSRSLFVAATPCRNCTKQLKSVCFHVPSPQGSKKHVGDGRMVEVSKSLPAWRKQLVKALQGAGWHHAPLLAGPVTLSLVFVLARPAAHFGSGRNAGQLRPKSPHWHSHRPDASKLQRAVEDALVDAGVLGDDSQIAVWSGCKEYGSLPGVRITLEAIEEQRGI